MVGGRGRPPRRVPVPRPRGRGRPPRDGRAKPPSLAECFFFRCNQILERLKKKDHYNIFLEPVDPKQVAEYDTIVKTPMAISMVAKKLQDSKYKSLGEFRRDLDLIWSNCLLFNGSEPNNVFSKKAIELRKVTEKLIAATRTDLEKDKEELHRWKERHRRNKPLGGNPVSTNIADTALLSTSVAPENGAANGTAHQSGTHSPISPVPDGRTNPQAAYEHALKQLLRNQYSSNTGLHRRGEKETAPEHYIAPDGSVVPISSVRHKPADTHWDEEPPIQKRRIDAVPDAIYNRIPRAWRHNMCSPLQNGDFVKVKDFVSSLHSFVKNAGDLSNKLVEEFLAPEYIVRDDQQRKRRRLEGNASQSLSSMLGPNRNLNAEDASNAIKSAFSDPLMSTCRLSFLPKLPRSTPELDGEDALHHFMPKHLVEQVKNVPLTVIDFASPHGVNAKVLEDVLRIVKMPNYGIDQSHLLCLENLYNTATDFARKQDPRAIAAFGGASSLSAKAVCELQLTISRQSEALSKIIPNGRPQPPPRSHLHPQVRRHDLQHYADSIRQRTQASMHGAVTAAGNQLPPIMSAAAQSMLPNELQNAATAQRLQEQNSKSRSRARNSVNSYLVRKDPTAHRGILNANGNPGISRNATASMTNVLGNSAAIGVPGASSAVASAASAMSPPLRNSMHMANITSNVSNPMNLGAAHKNHSIGGAGVPNPFFGASASQAGKARVQPGISQSQLQGMCHNCDTFNVQGFRLGGPSGRDQLCLACAMHWDVNKTHRPKPSLVEQGRLAPMRQQGVLPNLASAQNGLSSAMRSGAMNHVRSSSGQLHPLSSSISGLPSNATRVASMGMIMNSIPPQQQQTRKDFDSMNKQSSILPGLRNEENLQHQQRIAAQAKSVQNFSQLQHPNANSVNAPGLHPSQSIRGAISNNVNNLSRNLQVLAARPPNTQSLANQFALNAPPGMNPTSLNPANFGPTAKQAGMTAATASSTLGNPSSTFASHPTQSMHPLQMARIPQALPRGDMDAPLFGPNDSGGSSSVARAMSVPSIPPIMFEGSRDSKRDGVGVGANHGTVAGVGAPSAGSPQLDNIFSFDGAALGDGGTGPDFGF